MSPAVRGAVIGGVATGQHGPSGNQHMGIGLTMFAIICTSIFVGLFCAAIRDAIQTFRHKEYRLTAVAVVGALMLLSMILAIFGV